MMAQSTYLQAAEAVGEYAGFIPAARRVIFELYISYLHYRNLVCLLREQLHDNSILKAKHADIQHHSNNYQKKCHQDGHKCDLIISSSGSKAQFMTSKIITPITCNTNARKAHTIAKTEDLQKERSQTEGQMQEVEQINLDHHAFSANEELTSELRLQEEQWHTHQEEEFLQEVQEESTVQMTEESRQELSTSFSQRNVLTTELDTSYSSSSPLSTTPTTTTFLPELHQVQRSRNERISQWYRDAESELYDDYDDYDEEDHIDAAVLFDTNDNVINKSALFAPQHASLRASCAITPEIKEAIEGNVSELSKAMSQFSCTTNFAQVQQNSFLSSIQSERTNNSDENVISSNNDNHSRNVNIPSTQRRDMDNYVKVELEASNGHCTSPYDLRYALDDYGDVFFIEHVLLFPLQEEREKFNTPSCASPSLELTSITTNLEENVQQEMQAKEMYLNKQEEHHQEEEELEEEEEEEEEELAEWEREEREMHNEHIATNTIAAKDVAEIKENKKNGDNVIDKNEVSCRRCNHVAGNTSGSCLALTQSQQSMLLELLTLADFMGDDHLTRLCAHYLSCWLMQSTESEIIESFCQHDGVEQIPVDVNLTLFSQLNYFENNPFYNNNKERINWNVDDTGTNNFVTTNKLKNNSYTYERSHTFNKHGKNTTTPKTSSVFHTAKHLTCPLMYAEQKTASEVITSPSISCTYNIIDANNCKAVKRSFDECEVCNEDDESQHTKRIWTIPWVTRAALLRQTQQSNMGNKDNDL